jgi:hypothetical protein
MHLFTHVHIHTCACRDSLFVVYQTFDDILYVMVGADEYDEIVCMRFLNQSNIHFESVFIIHAQSTLSVCFVGCNSIQPVCDLLGIVNECLLTLCKKKLSVDTFIEKFATISTVLGKIFLGV